MTERTNLAKVPDVRKQVLQLLLQIPEGMVTTYGDLAEALGDKRAARAVGKIMAENRNPDKYPCWRVVRSDGRIGKYSGSRGKEGKKERMRDEGIRLDGERIVRFSEHRFEDFRIEEPLPELRKKQKIVAQLACRSSRKEFNPERIGGVDVSYKDDRAVGCYVEMDEKLEVLHKEFFSSRVKFPYIPSYLAYRELPILYPLLDEVRSERGLAEVILVDGNGFLHPRKAGLATHLGVVLDHPTVGVAKNLLLGEMKGGEPEPGGVKSICYEGNRVGRALKTVKNANPVYVSVGHRVDLDLSTKLVFETSKYKLPEPLREAHSSSRSRIKLGFDFD